MRLYITDSFRRSSAGYGAARSRHKAGFAIDMNVNGCNAACLCSGRSASNVGARNFLVAVMGDSTLHWGGDPSSPIRWPVGGCQYDSVHFESRQYEAGSNYDTVVPCLNRVTSFGSFSCSAGAGLLNEEVLMADQIEEDAGKTLSTGAIVAIAIFGALVVALCVAIAIGLAMRARRAKASGDGSEMNIANAAYAPENSLDGSTMMSARAERGGTIIGGGIGAFNCTICNKQYNYAEDLSAHMQMRHA